MRRDKPSGASRLAPLAINTALWLGIALASALSLPSVAIAQHDARAWAAAAEPASSRLIGSLPRDRNALARACLVAAAEAEARVGLPPGLLAAVAVTESAAHPFAIGAADRSAYPTTRDAAERLARTAGPGAAGGCFQINMDVHAPRDPSWVFDPWASALFAARKLAGHAEATGGATGMDWGAALARYAGARTGTEAARLYRCRVAASLAGIGREPPPGLGTGLCRGGEARAAMAKARTLFTRANGPTALAALP
jgi:hypothetical protein